MKNNWLFHFSRLEKPDSFNLSSDVVVSNLVLFLLFFSGFSPIFFTWCPKLDTDSSWGLSLLPVRIAGGFWLGKSQWVEMWWVGVHSHMRACANGCVGNIFDCSVSERPSSGVWEGACWACARIHGMCMRHMHAPHLLRAVKGMLGAGRPGEDLWESWVGSVQEEPLRVMQWRRCIAFNSPAQTLLALRKSPFCPSSGAEPWSQP